MKSFIKKIVAVIVSALLAVVALSFSACEKIDTLKVNFVANGESYSVEIDLYTYLAPETVKIIKEYAENGYYDNALFYLDETHGSQIMVGDYKLNGEEIVLNEQKPEIKGEFESNGYVFKNKEKVDFPLVNKKGVVGLWRNWCAIDNSYKASNGKDSGSSVLYFPTDTISSYDGYFCVFGVIDLEDESFSSAFNALTSVFSTADKFTEYVVYNTEETEGETKKLVNHILTSADFGALSTDERDEVYKASGADYVTLNKKTVKFSKTTYIKSIELK